MGELPKIPGLRPSELRGIEMEAFHAAEDEAFSRGDHEEGWRLRDEAHWAMVQMQNERIIQEARQEQEE